MQEGTRRCLGKYFAARLTRLSALSLAHPQPQKMVFGLPLESSSADLLEWEHPAWHGDLKTVTPSMEQTGCDSTLSQKQPPEQAAKALPSFGSIPTTVRGGQVTKNIPRNAAHLKKKFYS